MAFRNVLVEMKVGSTDWANITDDVMGRNPIQITRGRADETGATAPGKCNLTLNNRLGRYSPRNPLSPLYGLIGRGTPLRVSLGRGAFGLVLVEGGNGAGWASDTVATSITGDTDIRVDMEVLADSVQTWTGQFDVASKWEDNDPGRSWKFEIEAGFPRLTWYSLGTTASLRYVVSTAPIPGPTTGRRAVRVTIDVDNGAGGVDVRFYTAPNMAGTWTQLGSTVTQATTTAIFNGNAGTRFGAAGFLNTATHVTIYEGQLRNGINGTLVANPKFYLQPLDPVPFSLSSFSDGLGNTWSMIGSADAARIWYGDVDERFHGEIASLPPRWDISGNDAYVPIEAAGLLRRLGQGTDPAQTGLREFITNGATQPSELPVSLQSYWPLGGGEGTTYSLSLGLAHNLSARFDAQHSPTFSYGVDMGPYLGTGMELNDTGLGTAISDPHMRADINVGFPNGALDFVWQSPALGVLTVRLDDYSGNVWRLTLNTPADAGTLTVGFTAGDTGSGFGFAATSPIPELQDAGIHHLRFEVITNGANSDYFVYIDGVLVDDSTMPGYTLDGIATARFFYERYSPQTIMNMSHVTLWAHTNPLLYPTAAQVASAAFGYAGETAGERMVRIAGLGGIPLTVAGDPALTTTMGPQFSESKLAQIRDAEEADLGILGEQRDGIGLLYRPLYTLYNQTPVATIDFTAGELAFPFEPVDDDQYTRNDITAVRRDAGTYRVSKTTGPLSVLDPPNGVGRYKDEVTANVETDAQLPSVASWVLNYGTIDEARYPSVAVDLHNPAVVANTALAEGLLAADFGDRLAVINLDELNIYDDVSLLILGYDEVLDTFTHSLVFNCGPESPYNVAVYGSAVGTGPDRYDTAGSTLTTGLSSSATTFSVTTAAGNVPWTTTAGEFPFGIIVGGERMTVTNITSATSPQTFTVTRSVNGVVKAQSAGTAVRLWSTPRYAL